MTDLTARGQDPLDPATYFPPHIARRLTDGCTLTYGPDPVWDGHLYADLRDADGRLVETGNGATSAEAEADLERRLAR